MDQAQESTKQKPCLLAANTKLMRIGAVTVEATQTGQKTGFSSGTEALASTVGHKMSRMRYKWLSTWCSRARKVSMNSSVTSKYFAGLACVSVSPCPLGVVAFWRQCRIWLPVELVIG